MSDTRAADSVCSLPPCAPLVGEGWGGGWRVWPCRCLYLTTPTPNPSPQGAPQGGGERTDIAPSLSTICDCPAHKGEEAPHDVKGWERGWLCSASRRPVTKPRRPW